MKRLLAALLIASTAIGHVPVVTPSPRPKGDLPPHLERKPLPPVIFEHPITHTLVVMLPW